MVYYYLAKGFQEFVFLSDSINNGYEIFKQDIKQIFLFDDFLGRNFLTTKLLTNEEKRIVQFIEKINRSKNKILIFTTREYILKQAQQEYDLFDNPQLEFAKCIIDLEDYTKLIRAEILYNHLFFSNLPSVYIQNLLENENYLEIIEHENFNPRVIETVIREVLHKNINPNDFSKYFLKSLDYPRSIWEHAFKNQIQSLLQCILANLMSLGTPVFYEDLFRVMQNFSKLYSTKYGILVNEIEFKNAIQIMENSFIRTERDSSHKLIIKYQNPSVQDFLVNYFQELPDFVNDVLNSAIFLNQFFEVFSFQEKDQQNYAGGEIILNDSQKEIVISRLLKEYKSFESSKLIKTYFFRSSDFTWEEEIFSEYEKLYEIVWNIPIQKYPILKEFLSKKFQALLFPKDLDTSQLPIYIRLLKVFYFDYEFDKGQLLETLFNEKEFYLDDLFTFSELENIFPNEYESFIQNKDFKDSIYWIARNEVDNYKDDWETLLENVKGISEKFDVNLDKVISEIEDKIAEQESENKEEKEEDETQDYQPKNLNPIQNEEELIQIMFDTLRERLK